MPGTLGTEATADPVAGFIAAWPTNHGATLLPRARWQNFPTDPHHFLSYFAAHERHHRGQLCMLARQLGHRLPARVTGGIWDWMKRSRE